MHEGEQINWIDVSQVPQAIIFLNSIVPSADIHSHGICDLKNSATFKCTSETYRLNFHD
jgi:hypothetical protein